MNKNKDRYYMRIGFQPEKNTFVLISMNNNKNKCQEDTTNRGKIEGIEKYLSRIFDKSHRHVILDKKNAVIL